MLWTQTAARPWELAGLPSIVESGWSHLVTQYNTSQLQIDRKLTTYYISMYFSVPSTKYVKLGFTWCIEYLTWSQKQSIFDVMTCKNPNSHQQCAYILILLYCMERIRLQPCHQFDGCELSLHLPNTGHHHIHNYVLTLKAHLVYLCTSYV